MYPMPAPPSSPSHVARCHVQAAKPFSAVPFVDDFHDLLDIGKFAALRLSQNARPVLSERHGCERDTAVSAWSKHWWHLGGRSVSELSVYISSSDSTYVSRYEEQR